VLSLLSGAAVWATQSKKEPALSPYESGLRERQEKLRMASYPAYPNSWYKL